MAIAFVSASTAFGQSNTVVFGYATTSDTLLVMGFWNDSSYAIAVKRVVAS